MEKYFLEIIKNGGIRVMPTDTIYGLVGSALSKKAVERIYKVRKRDRKKPFIILISSVRDIERFGVLVSERHAEVLKALWSPAGISGKFIPVSVILPNYNKKFSYLDRGAGAIAFRLPRDKKLRNFLKKTGPLVAPSANISGRPPAKNIKEAKKYFGDKVDFYIDGGGINGSPSVLVEIKR